MAGRGSAWFGTAGMGATRLSASGLLGGITRAGNARKRGTMNEKNVDLARKTQNKPTAVQIKPLNMRRATFRLIGLAPYMQNRFSQKAMEKMAATQEAGQAARSKKNRVARDFSADYEGAFHRDADGRCGIPAGAFRAAMISACRLVGFKMTIAKLSVFSVADTFDQVDGVPLIFIKGKPEQCRMYVRNQTGVCDLRVRPMWREWSCDLGIEYDADQFSLEDMTNLLTRVGRQVGIGEGRPDSRESTGMGFGIFRLGTKEDK